MDSMDGLILISVDWHRNQLGIDLVIWINDMNWMLIKYCESDDD